MSADLEKGGSDGGMETEFVPMPGGYGYHKVRLRIEPELGVERSIAQPIAPEIHAKLG